MSLEDERFSDGVKPALQENRRWVGDHSNGFFEKPTEEGDLLPKGRIEVGTYLDIYGGGKINTE